MLAPLEARTTPQPLGPRRRWRCGRLRAQGDPRGVSFGLRASATLGRYLGITIQRFACVIDKVNGAGGLVSNDTPFLDDEVLRRVVVLRDVVARHERINDEHVDSDRPPRHRASRRKGWRMDAPQGDSCRDPVMRPLPRWRLAGPIGAFLARLLTRSRERMRKSSSRFQD